MLFTIITGLSGAGRSSALKAMEDMEFFCADNIPPQLMPSFADVCLKRTNPPKSVAAVVDMRMGDLFDSIYNAIEELKAMEEIELDILFLDASDEALISRFKQTRRRHPLSGSGKILDGISLEREMLQRIKDMADMVIDTSTYSVRMLTQKLEKRYSVSRDGRLILSVITFGYKRGIPLDADLVFDMRFLPNPFYIPSMRQSTGLDANVRDYVLGAPAAQRFLEMLVDMVSYLCPCFLEQDKKQLVIGIGCTGGMHRSVAIGEELFHRLADKEDFRVTIEHRDILLEKDAVTRRFLKAVRIDD